MKLFLRRRAGGWLLAAALGLFAAGCATPPRINWSERVGLCTFDQAVGEIGPPDKQAKLTDGSVVAEWITQPSRMQAFVSPGYCGGWPYGWGFHLPGPVDTVTTPEYGVRLTFGPDGRLTAWKKFIR
jgi:hypothetical protein